jgi:hypothetical protein
MANSYVITYHVNKDPINPYPANVENMVIS